MTGTTGLARLPVGHRRRLLDNGAGAFVGDDRQAVGDRILSGTLGQIVDAGFHREDVGGRAQSAQRRGAHRRLGHQMMDDALGWNVVKRVAVARRAAAVCFRDVAGRRLLHWIGQGDRAEQSAAGAGPQVMRRAPYFLRPVGGLAVLVEQGADFDDHRRAFWLVDEFFFSTPAHADRLARHLHGDDCRIGRGIVGAIVAVTARALHVLHRNGGRLQAERLHQCAAQRIDALAMRPDGEMAVLEQRQTAGRRDRGVGDVAAREGRFETQAALRVGRLRRADDLVDGWPLQQPGGFLLQGCRRLDVIPGDVIDRGGAGEIDGGFVVADDGEEIAGAHEGDRALGGAFDAGLVDVADLRAAVGLPHHAGVHHAIDLHVVDEDGIAENLRRQIEARGVMTDGHEIGHGFPRAATGGFCREIDGAGERPVILAGARAIAQDAAVANGQLARLAAHDLRGLRNKQRTHIGAGLPHGHGAGLDRHAARGVTLVRRYHGYAGADRDAAHGHIKLVGGDLRHRGEYALAEFDAAGVDGDLAGRGKRDPAVEHRVIVQHRWQHGGIHYFAPRITAAAFSTARMMRLCEPQRQMLPSSASAIS